MPQTNWFFHHLKSLFKANSKSISVVALVVGLLYALRKRSKQVLPVSKKPTKGNITSEFFIRLWRLIKIVIPSWRSREFFYIISLSILLVSRTIMSISLSDIKGKIVKSIVKKNGGKFIESVFFT